MSHGKMRLSVALCTYNGERYLAPQLESYRAQTRLPDELVVCDDGSKDQTAEIVKTFSRTAPFPVRLTVNPMTLGVTGNFDRAVSLCDGDIIALSDQDDVWLPGKLAAMESAFASDPNVGMVFSDAQLVDESLNPLPGTVSQSHKFGPRQWRKTEDGRLIDVLLRSFATLGAATAFHARLKPLLLPIPPSWPHDFWIGLVCSAVSRVVFLPQCLIRYRQHARQLTGVRESTLSQAMTRVAGTRGPELYRQEAERYRMLHDRLSGHAGQLVFPDLLTRIQAKARHVATRARIRQSLFLRLPLVLRELLTLRYSRYSRSWGCAVADLLYWGSRADTPSAR